MRKPEESLEDFTVKAMAIEKAAEPARVASLRFTGQIEVLKPLTPGVDNPPAAVGDEFVRPAPHRPSWFQRTLAFGGGLAVIAFIFLSAIFIGVYDPPPDRSVRSIDTVSDQSDAAIDQQLDSHVFTAENLSHTRDEHRPLHSTKRPRPEQASVKIVAYRPRRQPRRTQPVTTRFVPTTLVIFAENGEIKTRIEPRLAAVYNKPLTITN